jgi:hypothetical protein
MYSLGRKEGIGRYVWSDGSNYAGHWKDNMIVSYGIYHWLDGRCYEGEWVKNNM